MSCTSWESRIAAAANRSGFCLAAVPELTCSADIKLNVRVSLRRSVQILSSLQSCKSGHVPARLGVAAAAIPIGGGPASFPDRGIFGCFDKKRDQ
jgi:hypothetical protein